MSVARRGRAALFVGTLLVAAAAQACDAATDPAGERVAVVRLSDSAVTLRVGDDAPLVATVQATESGAPLVGRPIFWSTRDTAIATVSQAGVVRAVGVGSTQVAASAEGRGAVANVTVLARPIATLQAEPATVQLVVNGTQQLTARALNDLGAPTSVAVTWTSLDPGVVSVTAAGQVTALAPGVGSVRATADGISATAAVVVTPIPVASVRATPESVELVAGATQQLAALALDASGATLAGREIAWRSLDPAVAAVSSAGQLTALAPGATGAVASAEGRADTLAVTVRPVPVASVALVPNAASIGVRGTVRLAAIVRDAAGNALAGRGVSFQSGAANVATVASDGTVTGVAPGTATITATSEGARGTAAVTVVAATTVASVEVAPNAFTLAAGQTRTVAATPRAADGSVVAGRPVTWSSDAPDVATVSGGGVVTAVAAGTARVLAVVDGITGTATVTVQRAAVASVQIAPSSASVPAGGTTSLAATPRDQGGNALAGRAVAWSSSNDGVATVDGNGRVSAENPGTATIRATSEGVTGTAAITVTRVIFALPTAVTLRDFSNANRTAQLVATDHAGRLLLPPDLTWTSSDPAVATVTSLGVVRGISARGSTATAVITARYLGATATVTVTVRSN